MKKDEISDFADIELEAEVLMGLMMCNELDMYINTIRDEYFLSPQHLDIFNAIKSLEARGYQITPNVVRSELLGSGADIKVFMSVALKEITPSLSHSIAVLDEWSKKRKIYKELHKNLESLSNTSSLEISRNLNDLSDDLMMSMAGELRSYREVKSDIDKLPPLELVPTGVPFIDTKLKGGIQAGQFVLLMGDPEAGKTVLGTQIVKNVSNKEKAIFFPFEFTERSFIENNKENEAKFDHDNLFLESGNNDILDIAQKIRVFARNGGKVVLIDSQMMVTNINNKGTSEERETEKFFVLQRLCIKYELVIIFICQQGKEDTRSGTITPKGTKNGAHAAHQIWYIKKEKPEFDKSGQDKYRFEREFVMYKNKQNGKQYSKPLRLYTNTMEFTGRHYEEDDVRSKKYGETVVNFVRESEQSTMPII